MNGDGHQHHAGNNAWQALRSGVLQPQDVGEAKTVTTRSGLKLTDVRVGGGTPVNQGMLVILDYR